MTSEKVKCSCKNEYQDSEYGAGMRMANKMRTGQYRCTSCGAVCGSVVASVQTATEKVAAKAETKSKEKKGKPKKDNKGRRQK